ncbi:dihydrolipoyl dehydrogenase [Noviherbaspirillum sp. CPCC 100848]|uniref:Dihydrolipoyl dehydrogenase n=1 Tax=Noviherbaspirillum album TaxID=3080276 RepID=A0ABU6JFB8_9BURK|nr:dihydrolipoyl dehydrogenase [Noviherbaspirillum sp. CPCC 100848]MEC4722220.1 dihydrolipoyl dehydrogenase [Noviherbaspirillum sp. CPCC 100848]
MENQFDIAIIGAGSGGYIAAIRAGQLGLKVACIEANPYADPNGDPRPGGTCLNVGCIPSKALLASSEEYEKIVHHVAAHGISVNGVSMDVEKMVERKAGIVTKMTKGIEFLFRKNKVTFIKAHARFSAKTDAGFRIEVRGKRFDDVINAKNVIIATGSKARHLPGIPVDNVTICDNAGALDFTEVPKRLGVIGAGVIGLELGSVWRRLGADVTVLEAMADFLPGCDAAVSKELFKILGNQGLKFELGAKIGEVTTGNNSVQVTYTDREGQQRAFQCDKLVVAIGRVPNTENLNLGAIGLKVNARGFIDVDAHCKTALPNVYAIGDVVRGPMLAHKAEDEGVMVAEIIAGQAGHVNYGAIPSIIYTSPEVAWVGKTEQELKMEGVSYKAGQFPFTANGRALGNGDVQGFVKVLADTKTDRVLGVHIVSTYASEMIGEAVMAMEFVASSEDIGRISHAHPTLYEAIREAALAVDNRALNM